MFRTVFPSIIRISRLYIQQQAFVRHYCLLASNRQQCLFGCCMYSLELLMMDRPKHVQCYSNKINLRHWCIWLDLV